MQLYGEGHQYDQGYYLSDDIYKSWSIFVKTAPKSRKHKHFGKAQEAQRKDIERTFGVLQSRLAIVLGPARFYNMDVLANIMTCCVILHNMIVEDEKDMPDPLTMKILAQSSSLADTHDTLKHFLRRTERLKIGSAIISGRRISLSSIGAR